MQNHALITLPSQRESPKCLHLAYRTIFWKKLFNEFMIYVNELVLLEQLKQPTIQHVIFHPYPCKVIVGNFSNLFSHSLSFSLIILGNGAGCLITTVSKVPIPL